ncbi:transposase [Salipaludibacillus keqinensis]|uniref:transposase n=1 Tax=Salipaludibacillus keqinensis TaxID=2045207 RepID=UPI001304C343|nr:transposase [Salipaludibacillus keqinensis]
MGRPKREWHPSKYYHVIGKATRKDALFRNAEDKTFFLQLVNEAHQKSPIELLSYCFMKTHYHLQLRTQYQSLTKLMGPINRSYAKYYNKKYELRGPLFVDRFKSIENGGVDGILRVSRYIHDNPRKFTSKVENYKWSSIQYYLPNPTNHHVSPPDFIDIQTILNHFSGTLNEQKKAYLFWCRFKGL